MIFLFIPAIIYAVSMYAYDPDLSGIDSDYTEIDSSSIAEKFDVKIQSTNSY